MMEVSPSGLAARSQLVSNLAVAQLLVCFLAGLLRADPFVVAPLVALYAARERDRRALMLYGILVGAGILMDFVYLVAGAAVSWLVVGFVIVQLGLKLAVPPQPQPTLPSPVPRAPRPPPPPPPPRPPLRSPWHHHQPRPWPISLTLHLEPDATPRNVPWPSPEAGLHPCRQDARRAACRQGADAPHGGRERRRAGLC